MRFIYVSKLEGSDYVLTRQGQRPREFAELESVVGLPCSARAVRGALVRQPRLLAAFLRWDRHAPALAELEHAAATLVDELAHGRLSRYALWRVVVTAPALDDIRIPAPPPILPPVPEPEPEPASVEHWLTVEVLDADEQPAVGIGYELMLPDSEHRWGSTDGDGRIEVQGIGESGHCKLRFPDIDSEGPGLAGALAHEDVQIPYLRRFLSLPVDAAHVVRLPPEQIGAHYIEFDDVFFSFNSTALLPETKDNTPPTNAEGEPITGLNLVMAVLQYSEQFEGSKSLLINGHTDTVGSDADNVELAKLRAQVVYSLVTGERETFMAAVDAPHIASAETKAKILIPDKNFVLDWVADYTDWPCSLAENANDHWAATKQLQSHYNAHGAEFGGSAQLEVDRDFGNQTWGAVFDVYQDHIARTLELSHAQLRAKQDTLAWVAPQTKHTGCGEFHPLDAIGRDGFRSATNRRVEVTFFDPGEVPALECFAGGCAERRCELYDPHRFPRTPLPISWKALWKVAWDRPSEPARMGEFRDIILRAPKLADGSEVSFEVELEVHGQRSVIATLTADAEDQGARVSFGAWFDLEAVVHAPNILAVDEPYPEVRFHVRASTPEREVEGRRPLIYADTLDARVQHELVETELDAETVESAECLVYSPWGVKRALIDEYGVLLVEGLPPGGVMITIDGDPYFAQ